MDDDFEVNSPRDIVLTGVQRIQALEAELKQLKYKVRCTATLAAASLVHVKTAVGSALAALDKIQSFVNQELPPKR